MVQQVITSASCEGALVAVLDGTTTAEIENSINAYLASGSISNADIQVDPNSLK